MPFVTIVASLDTSQEIALNHANLLEEAIKPPDLNQPGCIKASSDPNHWKKKIDGAEVWWCGKCFTKKNNSIGCWTDTNKMSVPAFGTAKKHVKLFTNPGWMYPLLRTFCSLDISLLH